MLGGALRWWRRRVASRRSSLGRAGERIAAGYLRRRGFRVLGRNVRVRAGGGEADLVCLAPDRRTIVLVEVKTRSAQAASAGRFEPELAIDARKRRAMLAAGRALATRHGWRDRPVRLDVIAVRYDESGRHEVRHHVSAVHG
ncbi:MAG: YraN family protein [Planctomycetota bacterium]|nr:YraN family protein [Planctomycetota bacterium]